LKKTDRGEFDQLFNIYCEKKGKIVALGRGTKKIQSKLNGNLQQFGIINLMIANGKNYDHITSAQLVENFSGIKKDFKKIILASFSLELVEKLTKPGQGEPKVFILLKRFLDITPKTNAKMFQIILFILIFALNILTYIQAGMLAELRAFSDYIVMNGLVAGGAPEVSQFSIMYGMPVSIARAVLGIPLLLFALFLFFKKGKETGNISQ